MHIEVLIKPRVTIFLCMAVALAPPLAPDANGATNSDFPRYTIVTLPAPAEGQNRIVPRSINNQGEVVGIGYRRNGPWFAFSFGPGATSALHAPSSEAWDINEHGDVVGFFLAGENEERAALWKKEGQGRRVT